MTFQDIAHQTMDFIEANWPILRVLSIGSFAFFLITPVIAPLIIVFMPADVLVRAQIPLSSRPLGFRVFYLLWHIFKNALGITLILLGFTLLFMPGQGLLTMFVGAMLSDLPRKRSLLQKLLAQHSVRKVSESLRKKAGKVPLIYPEDKNVNSRVKVLFLCTGNSCRSQMAEGWARHLKGERIDACSAGIETHGLNPNAVRVMAESGVDISGYRSKNSAEFKDIQFDAVVTVCGHAQENCPVYLGKSKLIHKGFEDPPKLARELAEQGASEEEQLDCYRRVRDEIKAFVETLPDSLGV